MGQKIWALGIESFYWQFWVLLGLFTVFLFVLSFFISKSLSRQTCGAAVFPPQNGFAVSNTGTVRGHQTQITENVVRGR